MAHSNERAGPWFYFGCGQEAGHYLFDANGNKTQHWGDPSLHSLKQALAHFDAVLPPLSRDKFVAPLYVASFSTLGGLRYCALSWWDCSVDKRPASNSTVFAPGLDWEPAELLTTAMEKMPWVFSRLPRELALEVWLARPTEDKP
jgi:hypothetical protein